MPKADYYKMIELLNTRGYGTADRLTRLVAIAQIKYREPEGETAWFEIEKLIGSEATSALAFLIGFAAVPNPRWHTLLEGM